MGLALDAETLTNSLSVVLLVIVVSAILQDDLTCLAVGMYVSAGDVTLLPSLVACFVGTLLGDFFWFFSGRLFGTACLDRAPIKWVISSKHLVRAREFFEKHGPTTILLTRFLPVIRTPVQVAAGIFASNVSTCVLYFTMAAALYAPLLVVGSALLGNAIDVDALYEQYGHFALLGVAVFLWLLLAAIRFVLRQRV